jgi:hypothetical protein
VIGSLQEKKVGTEPELSSTMPEVHSAFVDFGEEFIVAFS